MPTDVVALWSSHLELAGTYPPKGTSEVKDESALPKILSREGRLVLSSKDDNGFDRLIASRHTASLSP
jgi:hypothetical protein